MTDNKQKMIDSKQPEEGCDISVWCEECRQSEYTTSGDKYHCVTCGKILNLNHEVHHEVFPHISGDDDSLS